MKLTLLIALKGLFVGAISSLVLLKELTIVSHCITQRNMKCGCFAMLGILLAQTIWLAIAAYLLFFTYKKIGISSKIVSFIGSVFLFIAAIFMHRAPQDESVGLRLSKHPTHIFFKLFISTSFNPFTALSYSGFVIALNPYSQGLIHFEPLLFIFATILGLTCFWTIFTLIVGKSNFLLMAEKRSDFHRLSVCACALFSLVNLMKIYFL